MLGEERGEGLVDLLQAGPQGAQLLGEQPHHQRRGREHGGVGGEGQSLADLVQQSI